MICNNCKKEITNPAAKFCPHCGSVVEPEVETQVNNEIPEVTETLQAGIATKVEEVKEEEVKNENQVENIEPKDTIETNNKSNNNKDIFKKYKVFIIAAIAVVCLALIGGGTLYYFSGTVEKGTKLKELLYGEKINIDGYEQKITKKNIDELVINHRNSKWRKYDNIESTLTLNLKNMEINVDADITIKFKDGEWVVRDIDVTSINKININSSSEKSIEEELKYCYFQYGEYDYIDLDSDVVKEISNIKISASKGLEGNFTADVTLSNGIVEAKYQIQGSLEYSLYDEEWQIEDSELKSKVIEEETVIEGGDEEGIGNIAKSVFEYGEKAEYKPEGSNDSASIWIYEKDIKEIKINKFNKEGDLLKVDLEIKAESGILKDIVINGTLSLTPSLVYPEVEESSLKIASLTYGELPVDDIKAALKEYTIENKPIDQAIIDTFTVTKTSNAGTPDETYVNGTITVNGQPLEIQVQGYASYDYEAEAYVWKLYGIYSKDSGMYKEI